MRLRGLRIVYVAVAALAATTAHGSPLFPAGAESKAAGMESALRSEGAPSVLYNPANLPQSAEKRAAQPYAELGLVNVSYTYEHPEFDPVEVSVTSPMATVGYTHRVNERLSVGGVVFPSESGKTEIPGLPRKVGGVLTAVEVETEDQVIDLGVGAGVKVLPGLSLGLSVVRTQESHALRASLPDNDNALVDIKYRNAFHRPVAGARWTPRAQLATTLAFRPALVKEYKGTQVSSTGEGTTAPKITDYEPATLSVGAAGKVQRYAASLEVQHQAWRQGRGVVKNGVYADEPSADLRDVTQVSVTGGYEVRRNAAATLAYARLPSPWGAGKDNGDLDSHVYGVDFGHLNGMDLDVLALGGEWRILGADLSLAAYRAEGKRQVRGEGDNVGFYSLGVTSVSGGFRRSF